MLAADAKEVKGNKPICVQDSIKPIATTHTHTHKEEKIMLELFKWGRWVRTEKIIADEICFPLFDCSNT